MVVPLNLHVKLLPVALGRPRSQLVLVYLNLPVRHLVPKTTTAVGPVVPVHLLVMLKQTVPNKETTVLVVV